MSTQRTTITEMTYSLAAQEISRAQDAGDAADYLNELDHLRKARAELEAATMTAVTMSRYHGATWTEVGMMLGMSKQGAQQKYGH